MLIPKLNPSGRDRKYKRHNLEEVVKIVHTWLFSDDVGHREMDRDILNLDPAITGGTSQWVYFIILG